MLDHALEVLEFHDLLEVVASYAHSAPGTARVRGIRPRPDPSAPASVGALYGDALRVLLEDGILPRLEMADVRPTLNRLAPAGAVVNGDELVECRRLLDAVRSTAAAREQEQFEHADHLNAAFDALHPCPALRDELHRALEDDGTIKDGASDELRRLRRRIRALESEIQQKLTALLHRGDMEGVIQEDFVTIRNDRFVVPIRREMKSRCRGIVHDHSDSGQTLFLEPSHTLPLGNELADLRLDERDERIRILSRLSARIRSSMHRFRENLDRLADLDAVFAVGRWAFGYECSVPQFGERMQLVAARHPLLLHQFRERGQDEVVVPLDFSLDGETAALAITGSNSGGKTVALKTIGLLSALAASGMPVPAAPESRFEFFQPIFADIGDEQSLAQNLSTFTGHISNIRTVLASLPEPGAGTKARALVLLDELGAGTDPLEGGALACAILEELVERPALTVLTTHLGVVKNVVHDGERMVNAAVRFNVQTLEPEYVLDVGQPGASNAFRIARRLGMPDGILDRAEALLGSDHLQLESLLSQLEDDQRRIACQERQSRVAMHDAERSRTQLRDELEQLRRERRKLLQDAYQQAAATVANTRKEMERLIQRLREAGKQGEVKEAAQHLRRNLQEKERKVQSGLQQTQERPQETLDPAHLRVGQRVFVKKLNGDAVVQSLRGDRKRATVAAGSIKCTVSTADLEPPREAVPESPKPFAKVSRPRPSGGSHPELNIIGRRVGEAEPKVEGFLDQAALAGLAEVRIIHGVGTGRLQAGVQEVLRRHPLVKDFRLGQDEKDPGGAGVTWVRLTEDE